MAAGGYESVAIALAAALSGGPAARLILNVRNGDTVPALPPDMVIEVPCRADASGTVPLPVSAPSAHQLGLMAAVRSCERDIADAALTTAGLGTPGGPETAAGPGAAASPGGAADAAARAAALALRAFAAHPLVGSLDAARSLAAALSATDRTSSLSAPDWIGDGTLTLTFSARPGGPVLAWGVTPADPSDAAAGSRVTFS